MPKPEEIKEMFGPSETGIIKENLSNENKDKAIEMFYTKYAENHEHLVKQNKDMDEMLLYLKENGFKLGIVTGKARRSLDISLEALKLEDLFDVIITGDDVKKPKPDPEGVIKALTLLDVHSVMQCSLVTVMQISMRGFKQNFILLVFNGCQNFKHQNLPFKRTASLQVLPSLSITLIKMFLVSHRWLY